MEVRILPYCQFKKTIKNMNELIKRITNQRHTKDEEFENIIRQELNNYCKTIPNDSDLGKNIRSNINK